MVALVLKELKCNCIRRVFLKNVEFRVFLENVEFRVFLKNVEFRVFLKNEASE